MARKKFISLLICAGILSDSITSIAAEPIKYDSFLGDMVALSEELSGKEVELAQGITDENEYSSDVQKAIQLGFIDIENDIDLNREVLKQDAVSILYKILIAEDPEYIISKDEATDILNECYDNALIREENKVAYASMIRHGVIGNTTLTEPNKVLTKNSIEFLKGRLLQVFKKKMPIKICDKEIFVGSSVNEVLSKFGTPDRIDANEFGFDWYVYNSMYSDFIMIGIMDDVVCAYLSNAENLEFDGLKYKDTASYVSKEDGLVIFRDTNGGFDGVWYNPYPAIETDGELNQDLELLDLVNSYRAKNQLLTLKPQELLDDNDMLSKKFNQTDSIEISADNAFEAYLNLSKAENISLIKEKSIKTSLLCSSIRLKTEDEAKNTWTVSIEKLPQTLLDAKVKTAPINQSNKDDKKITSIQKPKIVSPDSDELLTGDGNITIELAKRCANRYLVHVYDKENDTYAINAYINTTSNKIELPAYMFTKGVDYSVCVSSVDDNDESVFIDADSVEFTYGTAITPVSIVTPGENYQTYDSELEFYVTSSAYHNFRIDIYNQKNKVVLSEDLKGENIKILKSLPVGKYYACVTAINHSTGGDIANKFITVEIKPIVPVVTEIILEPGETYNYFYGTGLDYVYFYSEELIPCEVEEKADENPVEEPKDVEKESSENANNEENQEPANSEAPTEEEQKEDTGDDSKEDTNAVDQLILETEQKKQEELNQAKKKIVYKRKITQTRYPATKKYCKMAGIVPPRNLTNGILLSSDELSKSSQVGLSIVAMALTYQGVPYVWGGTSPSGFDCSGLVKYICNRLEISNVERTAAAQFNSSGKYVSREELQPGDFIYFQKNGVVHHVGIYIGNNMMVHAPHTGDHVRVANLSDSYYEREYAGAKRVY